MLTGEQKKAYQREYMAKKRALKKETVVVIPAILGKGKKVEVEWDEEKYPNREMWENAVGRAERAKRYAEMFPERTMPSDMRFQDMDYQYRTEMGIREEPKREVTDLKMIDQKCEACGGVWGATIEIGCPYCDGTGKRNLLTIRR